MSHKTDISSGSVSRRQVLRTGALAGSSLAAGCLGSGGNSGGLSLTIDYQPFYSEAFSALLVRYGDLWKKHLPEGYTVDGWNVALQGAPTVNRMVAEQIEIGYLGDNPTIIAAANTDTPIKVVSLSGYSMGQQCNLGVVSEDSSAGSVSDLDELSVSVVKGTCTHRFLLEVLEQEPIDPTLQDQGIRTILTELREGTVPVAFGWEPNMARMVYQEDAVQYLFTGADYEQPDLGAIIMPDRFTDEHPEAAKGWLKAELEAKQILATQQDRAVDLIKQEEELRDFERDTLKRTVYEQIPVSTGVERLHFYSDYEEVQPAANLLKRMGPEFLKTNQGVIDRIPPEDRFDTGLLREAMDELDDEVDWNPRRAART